MHIVYLFIMLLNVVQSFSFQRCAKLAMDIHWIDVAACSHSKQSLQRSRLLLLKTAASRQLWCNHSRYPSMLERGPSVNLLHSAMSVNDDASADSSHLQYPTLG